MTIDATAPVRRGDKPVKRSSVTSVTSTSSIDSTAPLRDDEKRSAEDKRDDRQKECQFFLSHGFCGCAWLCARFAGSLLLTPPHATVALEKTAGSLIRQKRPTACSATPPPGFRCEP